MSKPYSDVSLFSALAAGLEGAKPDTHHKKKRGRPVGWRMRLFLDQHYLTIEDFAFLRAVISGIDINDAFKRYYSHLYYDDQGLLALPDGISKSTHADNLIGVINKAVQHEQYRGLRVAFKTVTEPFVPDIAPEETKVEVHMSFDQWFETIDPDMYSERELPDRYQEFLEDSGVLAEKVPEMKSVLTRSQQLERKLTALNSLQSELAKPPKPTDGVGAWLAASVSTLLANTQVKTLADLVNFIGEGGRKWSANVRGLSRIRAKRIEDWVESHQTFLGKIDRTSPLWLAKRSLSTQLRPLVRPEFQPGKPHTDSSNGNAQQVSSPLALRAGIAPLELLYVPDELSGREGLFRTAVPNMFGANDDMQAIKTWLATFLFAGKQNTFVAYRREIERYYLWCVSEAKIAVSSAELRHALAYQVFLRSIPREYIGSERVSRDSPLWRPWRGQLDERSQKFALGIVAQFYTAAIKNNYLTGNPFHSVRMSITQQRVLDPSRSLTVQDKEWLKSKLKALSERSKRLHAEKMTDPAHSGGFIYTAALLRRTILILQLAVNTGMRLSEIANSTIEGIRPAVEDGHEVDDRFVITVEGKGRKTRDVFIPAALFELILSHHRDAKAALEMVGAAAQLRLDALKAHPPLVCALRAPVGHASALIDANAMMANDNLALGANGIYRTLKTFIRSACRDELKLAEKEVALAETRLAECRSDANPEDIVQLESAARKAKISLASWQRRLDISTHWLRHTFAREVINESDNEDKGLVAAQQLLGHASIATTAIYVKQDASDKLRAVRKINPLDL